MVDLWRDFWIRETRTGQQVAQLHERYMKKKKKEEEEEEEDEEEEEARRLLFLSWNNTLYFKVYCVCFLNAASCLLSLARVTIAEQQLCPGNFI